MSALLRRHRHQPAVIEFTLGRSSLAEVAAAVMSLLRDPQQRVTIEVVGFDYFDEHDVTAVSDLASWSSRVQVKGLDSFADLLLPPPRVVDVRSIAERAVTHLSSVTVLTAIVDGRPLDDYAFDEAVRLATSAGRGIVTVDLRHLARLSPAQLLALAESSAELQRRARTLMLVNSSRIVADQLRHGGLSGVLRMTADDIAGSIGDGF